MKKLIAISGPAGVGKGTLVQMLTERNEDIVASVSCTTRAPREGEIDGVHYFFLTKEAFLQKIGEDGFLEYDKHFDNYYGTPKDFVFETLQSKNVILEIEVNGVMAVKEKYPSLLTIMVVPPSLEALKNRLIGRNSETEETLQKRLARVEYELSFRDRYDEVVVNDDLEQAYSKLLKIIRSEITIRR